MIKYSIFKGVNSIANSNKNGVDYENEILGCIRNNPTGVNINDIQEITGFARNTVTKYLMALEAKGNVNVKLLGRNKIFLSADNSLVPKSVIQSFIKGVLAGLNKFPKIAPVIKELGKNLPKYMYRSMPKSLFEDLKELKDRKLILESFKDLYPNFDIFQDSYEISLKSIDSNNTSAVYRFTNSEFLNVEYINFFEAMCGVLEGFAKELFDTNIECKIDKIHLEDNPYIDISLSFKEEDK